MKEIKTYGDLAEECMCILNYITNYLHHTALQTAEETIKRYKNGLVKNYGEKNIYKAVRLAIELKTEIKIFYEENKYANIDISAIAFRIGKINKIKAELDKEIEECKYMN